MGKTKTKTETEVGIIRGVECTDGTKSDGKKWNRAGIKVEKSDGQLFTVATFEADDIAKANSLNGKEVEVTFTVSADGKWKNLVEGGIKSTITEETIGGEEEEKKEEAKTGETDSGVPTGDSASKKEEKVEDKPKKEESTKTKESLQRVNSYQNKENRVQTLIVRQNSWTQASLIVANLLKAVDVGILEKKNVEQITVTKMKELAHDIEADILRE